MRWTLASRRARGDGDGDRAGRSSGSAPARHRGRFRAGPAAQRLAGGGRTGGGRARPRRSGRHGTGPRHAAASPAVSPHRRVPADLARGRAVGAPARAADPHGRSAPAPGRSRSRRCRRRCRRGDRSAGGGAPGHACAILAAGLAWRRPRPRRRAAGVRSAQVHASTGRAPASRPRPSSVAARGAAPAPSLGGDVRRPPAAAAGRAGSRRWTRCGPRPSPQRDAGAAARRSTCSAPLLAARLALRSRIGPAGCGWPGAAHDLLRRPRRRPPTSSRCDAHGDRHGWRRRG